MDSLKNLGRFVDTVTRPAEPQWRDSARMALYFFATLAAFNAVVWSPTGSTGPDFDPIWNAVEKYVHGRPVYDEDYSTQDPHYLYSPGGTFLLAPIGLLPGRDDARTVMMLLGAACIFGGLWLLARTVAQRWRGEVFAALVLVACVFKEPVVSTLTYTNINGFLFLLEVIFAVLTVALLRRGVRQAQLRWEAVAAGVILGVAMTIKPQFVALAGVSLLAGHFTVLAVAGLFMAAVFAAGWLTMSHPEYYVERLVPYLGQARDYNNGSIEGVATQLGWSPAATTVALVAMWVAVAFALAALWGHKQQVPVLWVYSTMAVLFAGVLMSTGLLQGYYAIWLLPLMATVVMKDSPARWPVMWLAWWCLTSAAAAPENLWGETLLRWRSSLAWAGLPVIVAAWAVLVRRRGQRT